MLDKTRCNVENIFKISESTTAQHGATQLHNILMAFKSYVSSVNCILVMGLTGHVATCYLKNRQEKQDLHVTDAA